MGGLPWGDSDAAEERGKEIRPEPARVMPEGHAELVYRIGYSGSPIMNRLANFAVMVYHGVHQAMPDHAFLLRMVYR
uniref:hypothetical protein n=1 Tax=Cupriavidus taiwanensis TaxID=164546 RepID=UPI0011C0798C|nr:hypothetical protein [Cupriavidus taiwanensis]